MRRAVQDEWERVKLGFKQEDVTGGVSKSLNFALVLEELSAMGLPSSLAEMKDT